mmetsp:Transcript_64276/g.76085  ORF Transcript_64276/g.76085 Transcript_64276/m.76085 type:complete len:100 (+) Transcript_64276:91-390(+)
MTTTTKNPRLERNDGDNRCHHPPTATTNDDDVLLRDVAITYWLDRDASRRAGAFSRDDDGRHVPVVCEEFGVFERYIGFAARAFGMNGSLRGARKIKLP